MVLRVHRNDGSNLVSGPDTLVVVLPCVRTTLGLSCPWRQSGGSGQSQQIDALIGKTYPLPDDRLRWRILNSD